LSKATFLAEFSLLKGFWERPSIAELAHKLNRRGAPLIVSQLNGRFRVHHSAFKQYGKNQTSGPWTAPVPDFEHRGPRSDCGSAWNPGSKVSCFKSTCLGSNTSRSFDGPPSAASSIGDRD
jgi:hypothetical protein